MFGDDPIALIRQGLAQLAAEDRREWSGAGRSERLVELVSVAERLQAETIRAVGEWDARSDWALDAALSPRSWLTHRAPITRLAASRLVGAARLCQQHERTGNALRSGEMTCAHLDVLTPMVRNREPEYARSEAALVDAAAVLEPDDFAVLARAWRDIATDQVGTPDAGEIHDRRNLHVHSTLFGMGVIEGDLDAEGTEIVLRALDHACPPDPTGGPVPARSSAQRRADALVDICGGYLNGTGIGTRPPVDLHVILDIETLADDPPDDLRRLRCELERVGPIPLATALRLACDCAVIRVVMRGGSEVLDLGRSTRLVSPALRKALVIRDRGCVFPGCDRPPEWCDAHHLIPWEHLGLTNEDNCALLCRRHHILCHERGWSLTRARDGTIEVQPPAANHATRRRRGRAPPVAA